MKAYSFDTLNAARTLEAAGMERRLAEAVVLVVRDAQGDLATKTDVTKVEEEGTKVEQRVTKVDAAIHVVKAELGSSWWFMKILSVFVVAAIAIALFGALAGR